MLSSIDLKKLQECELLIADEIKRICEKNNISYFMVAGTLLGAVRHQGFIPWDDDMDFGMVRHEYERFCCACIDGLDRRFELQTWDTDGEYPFSFGKVRLRNTHVKELFASPDSLHDGIFVDIFPFDNVPNDPDLRKKQGRKYFFYKRALWIKRGYGQNIRKQSFKQNIKYLIFKFICSFISFKALKLKYDMIIKKYNLHETDALIFDAPYKYEKNIVRRSWIENLREYKFEDRVYFGIGDFDAYLTHLYNDYMELPKPEKRHSHDILKVDFGPYYQ